MKSGRDPVARLAAVNPVAGDLLVREHESETARALFAAIVATPPRTGRPPAPARRAGGSPRWRLRLVPLAVAASLAIGCAAWAILATRVSKPQTVACYEQADLHARTAVVSGGTDAVAACSRLWADTGFGSGPVPAMVACVLPSGVEGVFPVTSTGDVCQALGLAPAPAPAPSAPTTAPGSPEPGTPPPGPPPDEASRFLAFRDAVLAQTLGRGCIDPARAEVIVRTELDRAGLGAWTIRTGPGAAGEGFSAARPCAGLAFHPEQREIVLVPSPPPPGR